MTDLKKKTIFITGASSGIGLACARAFAAEGARLILSARRLERLETLTKELHKNHGTQAVTIKLDVRKQAAVQKAVEGLPEAWQKIDVLVNNAGLSRGLDKLHEGKLEDWEEMIDTNVKGLLYVSRAIIPGMVARGEGTIINIGSIAGHEVYVGGNVYCATKFAVNALTRGLGTILLTLPFACARSIRGSLRQSSAWFASTATNKGRRPSIKTSRLSHRMILPARSCIVQRDRRTFRLLKSLSFQPTRHPLHWFIARRNQRSSRFVASSLRPHRRRLTSGDRALPSNQPGVPPDILLLKTLSLT